MRRLITTAAIATVVIAAGALSSASADVPAVPPSATPATAPRLLTVNGTSDATVRSDAAKTVFVSAYRAQLAGALDDATAKATALAAKEGVTLGTIQAITEETSSPTEDCEGPMYAEGVASAGTAAPVAKRRTVKRHHTTTKKKAHIHARAVSAAVSEDDPGDDSYACDVAATVTVAYAIS